MQKLGEKHRFNGTNKALRHVRLRLKRRPEGKGLSEEAQEVRQRLRASHEAWQEAVEERIAQGAEVAYCDGILDGLAMDAARRVLAEVQNQRDAPLFKSLFIETPSEALKLIGGSAQDKFILNLIDGLQGQPQDGPLFPLAKPLSVAQAALSDALRDRDAAALGEAKAKARYDIDLEDAKRFYNQLFHRVSLLWPTDKALVESCFVQLAKPKKRKDSDPQDPSQDAEGDD